VGWLLRGFLPFLLAGTLFATEHYGYIHSGKKPIPGVTVTASLEKLRLVTTSDETGLYTFDLPDRGKWVFEVEMFGFAPAREEVNLVGGPSVLDFDLELRAGGVAEAPVAAPAAGFQTVDVKEQTASDPQIEQQVEATAAPPPTQTLGASDVNEAFLVNGSLSGGLQSVQQQNFFDQLDQDQTVVKKQKKPKSDLAPGEKRAKKAAKKARKEKVARRHGEQLRRRQAANPDQGQRALHIP
jgi:hypothetical protein